MAILRGDPTPEIVRKMMPNPGTGFGTITATGTLNAGLKVQRIPLNVTSTANSGAAAWINPEPGTVVAWPLLVITTAGSVQTFDMGRGSDGTGANNGIIDGATMTVGAHGEFTAVTATATVGILNRFWWAIGPGGTGANNSITVTQDDPTGTAAGYLLVSYYRVD